MKKKIWFWLFWIQTIVVIVCVLVTGGILFYHTVPTQVTDTSLKSYELQWEEESWYPEEGFVPDAKSAKAIGEEILDARLKINIIEKLLIPHATTVEYDEQNRLWMIRVTYLFTGGGDVVIDQDTGEVRYLLLAKL